MPEHSTVPDPQSPVAQVNLPEGSVEQMVRAHRRPAQDGGASRVLVAEGSRANPVEGSGGLPGLERTPGQTVVGQLLVTVKVVAWGFVVVERRRRKRERRAERIAWAIERARV